MILAMNLGNTNFTFYWVKDGLIRALRHKTRDINDNKDFISIISQSLEYSGVNRHEVTGIVLASVVPLLTDSLTSALQKIFQIQAFIIGKDISMELNTGNYGSNQLGNDRIAVCEAAIAKYNANAPIIVFDFGTATTVNVIDKEHNFLGGSILPGIAMGLAALSDSTAQLPLFDINNALDKAESLTAGGTTAETPLIGRNTQEALLSGAIMGNAAMLDGMVERITDYMGQKPIIIATGGNAGYILPYCRTDIIHEPELLAEGLFLLYYRNEII